MNNSIKSILMALPMVAILTGPAMAAFGESMDNGARNGSPVAIDSLLNRYSGVTPGQHGTSESDEQLVPLSQQFSAFNNAGATMSSDYTAQGSERIISDSGGSVEDSFASGRGVSANSEAATTSAGLAVVVRTGSGYDSLGAVAGGITPSSSAGGSRYQPSEILPADNVVFTTTIIPDVATPVPLPAAVVMFGSGLAALATLRKRAGMSSMQVS